MLNNDSATIERDPTISGSQIFLEWETTWEVVVFNKWVLSFFYLVLLFCIAVFYIGNATFKHTLFQVGLLSLVQLRAQEQALNWLMIRNWTGAVATKQASVTKLHDCKCCLSIFTKIKFLIKNRDSSMVFSVVVLLPKYNFCLRNIF